MSPRETSPGARAGPPNAAGEAAGPGVVLDRLFEAVYAELRRLAHRRLAAERDGHTLSTTALVHEVYLKLSGQSNVLQNREQFFALAAQAMRRILTDYARRHGAIKRAHVEANISLSALDATGSGYAAMATEGGAERADFLLALDEALDELRAIEARLALVVEYRFIVGLTEPETAELLGITARTVARDWVRARGWLYDRLRDVRARQSGGHPR